MLKDKRFIATGLTEFQQELAEAAKAYYQAHVILSTDEYRQVEKQWRELLQRAIYKPLTKDDLLM
jgi:hypothetical protein